MTQENEDRLAAVLSAQTEAIRALTDVIAAILSAPAESAPKKRKAKKEDPEKAQEAEPETPIEENEPPAVTREEAIRILTQLAAQEGRASCETLVKKYSETGVLSGVPAESLPDLVREARAALGVAKEAA